MYEQGDVSLVMSNHGDHSQYHGDVNLSPQNIIYHAQLISICTNVTMLINADNYGWLATSPNEPDMLQEIHKLTPRFEKRFISV